MFLLILIVLTNSCVGDGFVNAWSADAVNFTFHTTSSYNVDGTHYESSAEGFDLRGTLVYDPHANRSAVKLYSVRGTGPSLERDYYSYWPRTVDHRFPLGVMSGFDSPTSIDEANTGNATWMLLCVR